MEHINERTQSFLLRCAVCNICTSTSASAHLHICTYFMYSILFGVFQIDLTQFVQIFFRQCFCLSWASWDLQIWRSTSASVHICCLQTHTGFHLWVKTQLTSWLICFLIGAYFMQKLISIGRMGGWYVNSPWVICYIHHTIILDTSIILLQTHFLPIIDMLNIPLILLI